MPKLIMVWGRNVDNQQLYIQYGCNAIARSLSLSLSDPMYLKMQQNLMEKHEADKEGELDA